MQRSFFKIVVFIVTHLTLKINTMHPGIKAFFLSGSTPDMISRMDREIRMDILRKPVVPNELAGKMREVLDT